MPRSILAGAALLLFLLAGLKPATSQRLAPEFVIAVAPSVVAVQQGETTSLTVTITCQTYSLVVAADCNASPKFDFQFSEFPDGAHADAAPGRVGANTIAISASPDAAVGSFPILVTVVEGSTSQVQTFVLNIRQTAAALSVTQEPQQQLGVPAGVAITWEHRVLVAKSPEEFERKARNLGRDSWELVSVITRKGPGGAEWIGFFKRPGRT